MNSRVTFDWHSDPELLLVLAKAGDGPALVRLLDRYRDPLVEQLQGQVGRRFRVKLDIEDLLQDVSLEVYREIGHFRGSTEGEFRLLAAEDPRRNCDESRSPLLRHWTARSPSRATPGHL